MSQTTLDDGAVEFDDLITEIDAEMKRLGWDKQRGQRYLIDKYAVKSRVKLSDEQLFEFLDYLKSQTRVKVGQTAIFRDMKVVVERLINEAVSVVHLSPVQ